MMLQALYQLAHEEGLMEDPDYEWKPIRYLVHLDMAGRLLHIVDTQYVPVAEGKKKPKPIAKKFPVPRMPTRTSGDLAFWLFDKAEYVLGLDPDGKRPADKLTTRATLFREQARTICEATHDEGVAAVVHFLDDLAAGNQVANLPADCASNDLFSFVVGDEVEQLVTDRPAVRSRWKHERSQPGDSANAMCLVLGREAPLAELFPQLKRVPGGSTSGVGLVSFNAPAFESYGWSNNENAPVSREAAEACATALNRLLDPAYPDPKHPGSTLPVRHYRLSADTVVVYWAHSPKGQEVCNFFPSMFESREEEVGEMYRSVWNGHAPILDDPSAFYAITLTGTQGRVIVRDWLESTVQDVVDNLARYFADIDIVRNTPKPRAGELPRHLGLGTLLQSLAPLGKGDEIPAAIAAQVFRAALTGLPLPLSVLQRAIERMRAEMGKTEWMDLARRDARVALIKAVLSRGRNRKEITRAMDHNNNDPGYLLGRALAVIERMQQLALGDVNATVIDRFFAGASATPNSVFTRLLKGTRHHASKAKSLGDVKKERLAWWLEEELDGILEGCPPPFPASFDLQQQGQFVLGYHHERHWVWSSKAAREAALAAITEE